MPSITIPVTVFNTASNSTVQAAFVYVTDFFSVNGKMPEAAQAILQYQHCVPLSHAVNLTYNFATNVYAYCRSWPFGATAIIPEESIRGFNVTEAVYDCLISLNNKACEIVEQQENDDEKSFDAKVITGITAATVSAVAAFGLFKYYTNKKNAQHAESDVEAGNSQESAREFNARLLGGLGSRN